MNPAPAHSHRLAASAVRLACLVTTALAPAAAHSLSDDHFTPFIEERFTSDDNLYRISKDVDPTLVLGEPFRSDSYFTTTAGLLFDVPVSLQKFVGNVNVFRVNYNRFSGLDYDGHDIRAKWLWRAGDTTTGDIGVVDTETLGAFSELLTTTPDRVKIHQGFGSITQELAQHWRLHAGAGRLEQRNSDPGQLVNNMTIDTGEASLNWVSGSGNSIGLRARGEKGNFPNLQLFAPPIIDNAYHQYGIGPTIDWALSSATHFVAHGEQIRRRYDELPQHNFEGQVGSAELSWTPGTHFALAVTAQRDISPYELLRSSLVLVKGVALRPLIHLTPTVDLAAIYESDTRRYLADPTQPLCVADCRIDQVHSASALVTYRPHPKVTLQASAMHETRSSSAPFGDYVANVIWVSARLQF